MADYTRARAHERTHTHRSPRERKNNNTRFVLSQLQVLIHRMRRCLAVVDVEEKIKRLFIGMLRCDRLPVIESAFSSPPDLAA